MVHRLPDGLYPPRNYQSLYGEGGLVCNKPRMPLKELPVSHYAKISVKFANREALIDALVDMGWRRGQIEVNSVPVHLYGYHGDERPEMADIVIRRENVQGSANDIGFSTSTGDVIISDYDRSVAGALALLSAQKTGGYNEAWVNTLKDHYTGYVVQRKVNELQSKGKRVKITDDRRENGRRVITLDVR